MFIRKLTVLLVPLLLCMAVCLLLPIVAELGFFTPVIEGVLLGIALALLLPLSGATRRREAFGHLLWVPALLLALLLLAQFLLIQGSLQGALLLPLIPMQSEIPLAEAAFLGFMATTWLRTA